MSPPNSVGIEPASAIEALSQQIEHSLTNAPFSNLTVSSKPLDEQAKCFRAIGTHGQTEQIGGAPFKSLQNRRKPSFGHVHHTNGTLG